MSLGRAAVLVATAVALLHIRGAQALDACSAEDIMRQESFCPASGACAISKQYNIADGCTLDFSGRDVTLTAQAVLTIARGFRIFSHNLVLAATSASGATINGRNAAPEGHGGLVVIEASGDVTLQKTGFTRARIEVSAAGEAGTIRIHAAGSVTINGRLRADPEGNASSAVGGVIDITADRDLVTGIGSQLWANGGGLAEDGGGQITLIAGGKIDVGDVLVAYGSDQARIYVQAEGDVTLRGISGSASGAEGNGAEVEITAGQNMYILDNPIQLNGSDDQSYGGSGGGVELTASGDLVIATGIHADGRGPSGIGGYLDLDVAGSVSIESGIEISMRGYGEESSGGSIYGYIGGNFESSGRINLLAAENSDDSGVEIEAGGDLSIIGPVTTAAFGGNYIEGYGGYVSLQSAGSIVISNTIDTSAGACGEPSQCAQGGNVRISGCNVTLTDKGRIIAHGPGQGGEVEIHAARQLRVDGFINALHVGSNRYAEDGTVTLQFSQQQAPLIRNNVIQPAPALEALASCTSELNFDCINSCEMCASAPGEICVLPTAVATSTATPTATATRQPVTPSVSASLTATASATPTPIHTAVPSAVTATPIHTAVPSAVTATPSATELPRCSGDCGGDGQITVDELVLMVNVALGSADPVQCAAGDGNHDEEISIDEILAAVTRLIEGCDAHS